MGRYLNLRPLVVRHIHEPGRAATSLEAFFDLVFVVGAGSASDAFHEELVEAVPSSIAKFLVVSFAVWWTWVNFTGFASTFDNDDWLFRFLALTQMAGMLITNAGINSAFKNDYRILVLGYVIMRAAMISQWLRPCFGKGQAACAARVYALGIALVQVGWILWAYVPKNEPPYIIPVLIVAELSVPIFAEWLGQTAWHPHHVSERFGLYTIIQLGECISGAENAIKAAVDDRPLRTRLIGVFMCAFVINAALWWIYFYSAHHERLTSFRNTFIYAYLHYFIFTAAGAFSADVDASIDSIQGQSALSPWLTSFTVTVPVAVFILGTLCAVIYHQSDWYVRAAIIVASCIIQLDACINLYTNMPMILTTVVVTIVVCILVWRQDPRPPSARSNSVQFSVISN